MIDKNHYRPPSPILPQKPQPVRIDTPRIEVQRTVEKPVVVIGPSIGGGSVQTKQDAPTPALPPAPTFKENREMPKPPQKTAGPPKTEAFSTRKDCLHQFGYLRTFPKNSPIPDECFDCEKIVDCLVNSKKSNGKNERLR